MMRRNAARLVLVVAVLAAACSGAAPEPEPELVLPMQTQAEFADALADERTSDFTTTTVAQEPDVPLSFLLRQTQSEFGQTLGRFLCDRDYWTTGNLCDLANVADNGAYDWTTSNQCFAMVVEDGIRGCKSDGVRMTVTFHGWTFDPDASDLVYGPVSHKKSQPKEYNGVGYLAELHDFDEEVPFQQTVTVTEAKVRSVETTRTLVIDWGVESEQKVGGEFPGASFEASLKEHFSVSDSTETKQAEEDSTSTEVSHEISFNFPPYKDTLLTINTISITTKRPLNGNLVWTGGFTVYVCGGGDIQPLSTLISSWELLTDERNKDAKDTGNDCWEFTWQSIDDFEDTFHGVNVDWPGFVDHGDQVTKYPPRPQRLAEITSNSARTSVVATTETRTFDGSISIIPEDVTGQDPDQVLADHGLDADAVIHGDRVGVAR